MNRKPEIKTAAAILTNAFAEQGVKLGHQAALNLLATLEGFESYAHMKAAQSNVVAVKEVAVAEPEKGERYLVHLLFGEEETEAYMKAQESEDEDEMREVLSQMKCFSFPTTAMRNTFLDGVEEACGWLSYNIVDSDVQKVFAGQPLPCRIEELN